MEEVHLKIDSKGRLCLPAEIREQVGETAILKRTHEGYLIVPGKKIDFQEEFRKIINSEPKRRGKPKLACPKEMKTVWKQKT
jgi:DNA-binding transcriptional regulator/RsmH inhibitor MraZ